MTDFDNATEIDPQFEDAYYYRASAKTRLGDHQGAIADWTKVIETYPQSGLDGLAYTETVGLIRHGLKIMKVPVLTGKKPSLGDEDAAGWSMSSVRDIPSLLYGDYLVLLHLDPQRASGSVVLFGCHREVRSYLSNRYE